MHFLQEMLLLAKKVQCRLRKPMLRILRESCLRRMWTLILKRKKLGSQQTILLLLAPSHKNLDQLIPLSWKKVHCKTRTMIEKQLKIGRETERFHKNLRLQRTS